MTTTRLLVLRHGESTWNAAGLWQGAADPPLSSRGREQALAAAAALTRLGPFELVVTSCLDRAATTGRVIADVLGVRVGLCRQGLNERDVGEWQGLTNRVIDDRYPGARVAGHTPERWESDDDVLVRASETITRLAAAHPGTNVLVVAHGGVIGVLQRNGGIDGPRIGNLDGYWLHVEHDGPNAGIVVGAHVTLLGAAPGEPVSGLPL